MSATNKGTVRLVTQAPNTPRKMTWTHTEQPSEAPPRTFISGTQDAPVSASTAKKVELNSIRSRS